jgi:palmitoyltransferase ZDHHC9/14/18
MSTPPTSLGDESSVLSDVAKMEVNIETNVEIPPSPTVSDTPVAAQSTPTAPSSEGRRPPRASRASVTTYNVQILAGTAIHTPTKYLEKHHGNVLHGPLESVLKTNLTPPRRRGIKVDPEDISDPAEAQLATEAAQAAQRRTSSRVDLRKEVTRRNLTAAAGGLAQRGSELISSVGSKVGNALGVSGARSRGAGGSSARAGKSEDDDTEQEEEKEYLKPKTKEWMKQGLYVGQHREFDPRLKESQNRLRRKSKKVEESKIIPLPMFSGERMLTGEYRRDFKLPFDVYHPLPRKVKVDGWIKLQKSAH